ncbi:MAG: hypothetical protein UX30_C0005G0056 [Candidatus Saccharibacteria bacterium GW2011_GWA2_46_10]|nr:MAG: hypothetical protein UX30_C0005G0056 [Candidatus Saccharibacteria bacterium GW2011_GWA2_46_10]OGL36129.1 MAG: hypothetical protein A3F05_01450 [Candidatus Saccharibacteria bacterium RIFCSPHIGHO2_12_FULL_47_17]
MRELPAPQNSPLRKLFKAPVEGALDVIDRRWPWIQPDHVTLAGTAAVLGVDAVVARYPRSGIFLWPAYAAASLTDVIDGALARRRAAQSSTETTSKGAIIDTVSDKAQELMTWYSLAAMAQRRGDRVAAVLHTLSGMSSTLPALFRARAEAGAVTVAENAMGSRPIRGIVGGVAMGLNGNRLVSRTLAGSMTVMNITTALQRSRALVPGSKYKFGDLEDLDKVGAAQERYSVLKVVTPVGIAIGSVLLAQQLRRR